MTTTLDTTQEQSGLLDDYYTPQEVAALLKFRTPRPVYDAIGSEDLAAIQLSGRLYRISRSDLLDWLYRHRREGQAGTGKPAPVKPPRRPMSTAEMLGEAT